MKEKTFITFFINGLETTVTANDVGPQMSLNSYLRTKAFLTGTKKMCFEGGCGLCTVAVEETVNGKPHIFAVNSCLVSVLSCDGWRINTIEGIGNTLIGYHPIQKLLSDNYGTQCGFCAPGMVMSMYALQQSGPKTQKEIENSFGGNLCRCTGYRPILHAFKQLASDSDNKLMDIEDLKLCPNVPGKICTNECQKPKENFVLNMTDSRWIKVLDLKGLLDTLKSLTTNNYMLVCGNTAKGVFKDTPSADMYIDVRNVEELTTNIISSDSLVIGGNVTLTQWMAICKEYSPRTNFSFLSTIEQHLDLVAAVQVRNIGSIAGNLMIKYQHNAFQSDIFLLLETFNGRITTVDVDGKETTTSPQEFLNLDMTKKVIKSVTLNALDNSYRYATYKIMPRAQYAHAILNAGFLVQIQNDVVRSARIVYGAVNPSFVHATATEKLLVGQNLYDNVTLQKVFDSLNSELICDNVPPEPSAEYRKNLAIGLFYKFVLKTSPPALIGDRYKSGGTLLERPVSKGSQEFGTTPSEYPLTQPIPKIESLAQSSGRTKFIMDTAALSNELYAEFVTAKTSPGSTILTIDASDALKLDGVIAFYDKNDIPGVNTFTPADVGLFPVQEELFCSGKVQYYHQPIGIIVATSEGVAARAANMVKITYNAPKDKIYINAKEVVKDNVQSRITLQSTITAKSRGTDIKQTISGEFYTGMQYHFHMELHACKVVPTEDGLDIYPTTQWMDSNQLAAAAVLGMSSQKINVEVRRIGGGFGGKMFRNALVSSATALAAHKLQQPVTMSLSLEQNMHIIGKRYPLYMKYEADVNDKGVIQNLRSRLYVDCGVGGNEPIDSLLLNGFKSAYNTDSWDCTTFTVQTDMHANCYTRAPGTMEGLAAIESIMENIAYNLNLEPMAVKLANTSSSIPQIPKYWTDLQKWADIENRKQDVIKFNQENRWMKQGLAVVPMKWVLEIAGSYSVLVSIFHGDGGVAISHGGVEMGQGINTKAAQVCAYKLGIPLDKVSIKPNYSFVAPNSYASGGSLTSEAICYGVIKACDTLLARMKPIRDKMTNPTWEELIKKCYDNLIELSAPGFFYATAPDVEEYPIFGMCSATVQVDLLTGKQEILQVDILEDLGESMSPLVDIGQIEGALVMGIGFYTIEDIIFDEKGMLLTDRTWNYKVPGVKDIPINFRIKFAENSQNPVGVLKSKAVAEPPQCLSVAVPLAIRNALASARKEVDPTISKFIPFDGPTTVEYTFMNSLNNYKQFVLK